MKMSVLPNLIFGFNAILIKITGSHFMDIDKLTVKLTQKGKRPRTVNRTLKERSKLED